MGDAKVSHEQEHLASLYHCITKVERNLGWSTHLKEESLAAGRRESCLKLGKIYSSCGLDFIVPKGSIKAAEERKTSIVSPNTKH